MFREINIDELVPGMYVNDVIKQSGLLKVKKKGLVKTQKTIDALNKQGVLVLQIDESKSQVAEEPATEEVPATKMAKGKPEKPISEQLTQANKLYKKAKDIQRDYVERIRNDQNVDLDSLYELSHGIIDSVFEAPNALSCLALLQKTDEYLLEHSLNCSILMAMFARHLKFDSATIGELGLAALVMDIGMANVPEDITSKTAKLTKNELDIISTHVDVGLDILERSGDVSEIVRDIVFSHHERIDGSGYPDAKQGDDISIYVNMAAIVDSYDAMTTNRPYQKAMTATAALKSLLRDQRYDQTLVQQFIQCMSVHPVGSLVKLTNDRLAIVLKANPKSPLQPIVASFYHVKSGNYAETKMLDLRKATEEIESAVRPEEFGINLTKFFQQVFLPT